MKLTEYLTIALKTCTHPVNIKSSWTADRLEDYCRHLKITFTERINRFF